MIICGPLSAAKIYKWTDENGETHFGSVPPHKNESLSKTRYNTKKVVKQETDELILQHWYGNNSKHSVEFSLFDSKHLLLLINKKGKKKYNQGTWSLNSRILTLQSSTGNKRFVIAKISPKVMKLLEYEADKKTLKDKMSLYSWPNEDRFLSQKEDLLSGIWKEKAHPKSTKISYVWEFANGSFSGSDVDRYAENSPNPNRIRARGYWKIKGDFFIQDYVYGEKSYFGMVGSQQKWKIKKLDHRNLIIKNKYGTRTFTRQRKRKNKR